MRPSRIQMLTSAAMLPSRGSTTVPPSRSNVREDPVSTATFRSLEPLAHSKPTDPRRKKRGADNGCWYAQQGQPADCISETYFRIAPQRLTSPIGDFFATQTRPETVRMSASGSDARLPRHATCWSGLTSTNGAANRSSATWQSSCTAASGMRREAAASRSCRPGAKFTAPTRLYSLPKLSKSERCPASHLCGSLFPAAALGTYTPGSGGRDVEIRRGVVVSDHYR